MMAAAATVHVAVAVPVSPDLDHRIVLGGKGCHAEPCGGGRCDGEDRRDCGDGNEQEAFHDFLQIAGWRLIDTISRSLNCSIDAADSRCQADNFEARCRFIPLARSYQPAGNCGRKPNIPKLGCS
jgi:hypothetical protein